jgi:2-methylisocitrate lyase-like PEP mutase family enzyme
MNAINVQRTPWKVVLAEHAPLILPAAHDALTARIICRAGFPAFQVGGFAVAGAMHATPDVDLEHYGEKSSIVRKIIHASSIPALVDADDGYGDAKNVTRTVQEYELIGASAIFLEDQTAPKQCGHMAGKHVVSTRQMVNKLRAAVAARTNSDFFILARTDAIEPEGLDKALRRAEAYLKAGADGVYLEGPTTKKELRTIGRTFKGVPLAVSILERGGKTPWLPPREFHAMGFSMLLYPTSIIFRVARAIELAVSDLKRGQPISKTDSVDMPRFETIVEMPYWAGIEKKFPT